MKSELPSQDCWDKSASAELKSPALRGTLAIMKSIIPDPAQLDELAAGLDAGWDEQPTAAVDAGWSEERASTLPSQPPHSTPLPEALDALDADWDVAAQPAAAAPSPSPARSGQPRPGGMRPSRERPNPTRAVTPLLAGPAPAVRASKQERRDAERKRRAHEAQQKSANKKQRKAERQAEAQRASELQRAAEQQALAERRARQGVARNRAKPKAQPAKHAAAAAASATIATERTVKRARREKAAPVLPALETLPAKRAARPVIEERGAKKLIVPFLIALLFAVTLGFALSRAR